MVYIVMNREKVRVTRNKTFRRINFLGIMQPPQAGPDTTLVVTDIQVSNGREAEGQRGY
jgi:hypothetical protein